MSFTSDRWILQVVSWLEKKPLWSIYWVGCLIKQRAMKKRFVADQTTIESNIDFKAFVTAWNSRGNVDSVFCIPPETPVNFDGWFYDVFRIALVVMACAPIRRQRVWRKSSSLVRCSPYRGSLWIFAVKALIASNLVSVMLASLNLRNIFFTCRAVRCFDLRSLVSEVFFVSCLSFSWCLVFVVKAGMLRPSFSDSFTRDVGCGNEVDDSSMLLSLNIHLTTSINFLWFFSLIWIHV